LTPFKLELAPGARITGAPANVPFIATGEGRNVEGLPDPAVRVVVTD
jgi:hypothetical protein